VPAGLNIDTTLGIGFISSGSARIVATSSALVCDAFVADKAAGPPNSMMYLTIVAKAKQKAAN
jgi:hypothetical protein